MEFLRVTEAHPLYPLAGWERHNLPTETSYLFTGAYRDPAALLEAWVAACFLAGRIDTDRPEHVRVVVRADGIADKPYTYHVGLVLADDKRRMSGFSQRDFCVGKYPEKNQFAMFHCATQIGQLAAELRVRGGDLYLNCDMTALKNLSRGLNLQPGGFGIKDFNKSVPVFLHARGIPCCRPSVTWVRGGLKRCQGPVLHPYRPPPPEKGFCIWHRDCKKTDWNLEYLSEHWADETTVDGPDAGPYDPTGIPPRRKVPCTHHLQKNDLGSLADTIVQDVPGDKQELIRLLKGIKWGAGPFCPLASA